MVLSVTWMVLAMLSHKLAFSLPECDTSGSTDQSSECTVTSKESGNEDDSTADAICPVGYSMVDCELAQVTFKCSVFISLIMCD
jgi:hypothetical protein